MTERLLQFIWQFQYFNKGELTTSRGKINRSFFPVNITQTRALIFWKKD